MRDSDSMTQAIKKNRKTKKQLRREQVWFGKMLILMTLILTLLILGQYYSNRSTRSRLVQGTRYVVNNEQDQSGWWPTSAKLATRLDIIPKDPWKLSPQDLTIKRVIYNVVTKPGFRTLMLEVVLMGMGLTTMIKGAEYAYVWQRLQMRRAVGLAKDVSSRGVLLEVGGTVRIEAKQGVIYVSTVSPVNGKVFNTFSFELRWLPLKVVKV
jgi:hypothetical protein